MTRATKALGMFVVIASLVGACSSMDDGSTGYVVRHDFHYRNPWYGFGPFPPPRYIGPPPVIVPPPVIINPPIFEAVPHGL